MNPHHYDIVIAGGGMIGSSLALALAPLGLRVAVVEAIEPGSAAQPSFDERSTALSRSSQRMFTAMGLWDEIAAASTPIRRIHVSDKGRFGLSHIDADEQGVEALGYVVINRVLGEVLQRQLRSATNIDWLCPRKVTSVRDEQGSVAVTVSQDPEVLQATLLIAADGARSRVREMLGVGVQQTTYGQHAVIGNLQSERPLDGVAYERFTEQGPLALLPVAGDRAAFVWTIADADVQRVLELPDRDFLTELQAQFGYRLGAFSKVGQRVSYPLGLSRAMRLTASRSVLVGNAAHGLHPVAAQGFNLGLRDVASLCDCVADACANGTDIGSAAVLDRYAGWRREDQSKLVHFTDHLVRAFGSRRPATRAARSLGMLGFDLIPGVRRLFARHTMGLAGHLPRLSRGVPLP